MLSYRKTVTPQRETSCTIKGYGKKIKNTASKNTGAELLVLFETPQI